MIMYAWKQFGNDFRNGDDAVFWDSNRPRDDNGTKIRPWLQGDKWSFRETNKKTDFSMLQMGGMTMINQSVAWNYVRREVPKLVKWKWSASDLPDGLTEQDLKNMQFKNWLKDFDNIFMYDPKYLLTESNVTYTSGEGLTLATKTKDTTYIEILEDGLYYILVNWVFYFWNPNYDSVNSYKDKVWVYLFQEDKDWVFTSSEWQSYRCTWNLASYQCTVCGCYPKWTRFLPAYACLCYQNYSCFCASTFRIIKLW